MRYSGVVNPDSLSLLKAALSLKSSRWLQPL
jgi:hypothetical protein